MATTSALYNALPTIDEAIEIFVEREKVFKAIKPLLTKYGNAFGVCLVHAHCTLDDGEVMLARGDVSQPEKESSIGEYYPERWLPTGEPYEFTKTPTTTPPAELFNEFRRITGFSDVLGLYYVDNEDRIKKIEHTEGRKNILSPYPDDSQLQAANVAETGWNFGKGDPVTFGCYFYCPVRVNRSGFTVHKGRGSFLRSVDISQADRTSSPKKDLNSGHTNGSHPKHSDYRIHRWSSRRALWI